MSAFRGNGILQRSPLGVLALVAAWLSSPVIARADHIDMELNKQAPKALQFLSEHGCKTAGVLKFRVEKPGAKDPFSVGSMNSSMVIRLENALITHVDRDEARAIGIIHEAAKTAAPRKVGRWYEDVKERGKLFSISDYPLAWGKSKVKADAFLTGVVKLSPDLEKTTVTIQAFTAKDPAKLQTVAQFTVDTDRNILRDLGESFVVSRRGPAGKNATALNQQAIRKVLRKRGPDDEPVTPTTPTTPTAPTPGNLGGIEVKVQFDGQEQQPTPESAGSAQWQLPNRAEAGKPVVIVLRNTGDKARGVTLLINGQNTITAEGAEPTAKWVIQPGKEYQIKGFYKSLKEVQLFKVLPLDESLAKQSELGDKYGMIEVNVYESGETGDPFEFSTRGPSRSTYARSRGSLATLQDTLLQSSRQKRVVQVAKVNGKVIKRELIVADDTAIKEATLKQVEFPNPTLVGGLTIKYTQPTAPTGTTPATTTGDQP